jgi:hypothetical protein
MDLQDTITIYRAVRNTPIPEGAGKEEVFAIWDNRLAQLATEFGVSVDEAKASLLALQMIITIMGALPQPEPPSEN